MGLGNIIGAGAQNALTSLQQSVNLTGGQMQEAAANTQAASLQSEANESMQQTQLTAEQAMLQEKQAYGQQAEGYASSGVEQVGSPMQMLNQTQMLGQQQVNSIEQAGQEQANLYNTQASMAQQTGLADLLSVEGENQASGEQNQLSQKQQENQVMESFLGMGTSLLGGLIKPV